MTSTLKPGMAQMPGAARTPAIGMPVDPGRPTVTVATYPDYASAQRAVDYLSDNKFPVEHTAIVGTDLRLVERVLGRLTTGRAAMAGLASGAWFGLFIGLLLGIFAVGNWFAVVAAGLLIGAVWGAIFGAFAHAMTRGARDFTSQSMLDAGQYAVTVTAEHADASRQLLARLEPQNPSVSR
jgi:Heat induced stress protein YflT domain